MASTRVEVGGKTYQVDGLPENYTQEDLAEAVDELVSQKSGHWYDAPRQALKGMTLGWSDEMGASGAANAAYVAQGGPFGDKAYSDIYNDIHETVNWEQDQYEKNNSGKALALEAVGGVATGAATGAAAMPALLSRGLSAPLATSLLAGTEGAIYGAGDNEDSRGKGALTTGLLSAAVAPPLAAAGGFLGNKAADLGHGLWNKVVETPANTARRLVSDTIESAGKSVDDVARTMDDLGPDGVLADADENLRGLTRGLSDQFGPMKREARELVEPRQLGAVGRVKDSVRSSISEGDAAESVSQIAASRNAQAAPLYESAYKVEPSEGMAQVLTESPDTIKKASKLGKEIADARGEVTSPFQQFHYIKMGLDRMISQARNKEGGGTYTRALTTLKNKLLAEMDAASPDYKQARNVYAGESALLDAIEEGRNFFKYSASDFANARKGMGDSELEYFRQGAVQAILDKLDNTQLTHDAAKKLINTKALQDKLGVLFGSEEDAVSFIRQMAREAEFTRTRQVVTGGSPTSQNLATQQGINDTVNDVASIVGSGADGGLNLLGKMFTKKPPSPEVIGEASNLLLNQGLSGDDIIRVLARNPLLGDRTPSPVMGAMYRGAIAPAAIPLLGGDR